MNRIKSVMLLATLTALILWVGQALGGQSGLMLGLIFAAVMNFGAYWWSDQIVLRMYGAREIDPSQAPELWSMVSDLAQRMSVKAAEVVKKLMGMGVMATVNQSIEQDVAQLLVEDGYRGRVLSL